SPEEVFMEIRHPLEWHCKQMDHFVGLNFSTNFNFALVGHLLKGYRHPSPTTVARTRREQLELQAVMNGFQALSSKSASSPGPPSTPCHAQPSTQSSFNMTTFSIGAVQEPQPWTSPQVSERYLSTHHYPTMGQISPRTRKSMSLDMGQPSQANTKKLLGMEYV
ncbi:hypothetical protein GOODEAATRI_025499, partial [Goodea atripinnis]